MKERAVRRVHLSSTKVQFWVIMPPELEDGKADDEASASRIDIQYAHGMVVIASAGSRCRFVRRLAFMAVATALKSRS